MARPTKKGLDYFPLDVVLDIKFELIEAEFGLNGFGVVVKLYQEIYKQGYYIEWTSEVALLFSRKIGLGGNAVSEIVKAAVRRGIFDRDLFEKYGILTSDGIQRRYIEGMKRREKIEMEQAYLLLDCSQLPVNVNINRINVNRNAEKVNNNTQSKVKKSKVNKSIENSVSCETQKPTRHKYGFYKNVLLSDDDMEKLKAEFPTDWQERIDRLSEYIASTGKSYKNHLATIRSWARKDKQNDKSRIVTGLWSTDDDDELPFDI